MEKEGEGERREKERGWRRREKERREYVPLHKTCSPELPTNKQTNKHLSVNVGEMLHGHCVDILIGPQPLFVIDEPVLEQPERLVRPHPHQTLDGQRLQGLEGLVDALHPARHLTWTVDVVRLHLLSETFLEEEKQRTTK